jgi:uncharacterized protein involved in exopolysaccharide biosynthesis
MEDSQPLVTRKLVETACRLWWLLLLPIVVVPAAVWYLTRFPTVYESVGTIWVAEPELARQQTLRNVYPPTTPARVQVQVLNDLLSTQSFREQVAVEAGIVAADAPPAERSAAAERVAESVHVSEFGPNLLGVRATTASPADAQRLASGTVNMYLRRSRADSSREISVVLAYYEKQVSTARGDLASAEADLAAYLKSRPVATAPAPATPADAQLQALQAKVDVQTRLYERLLQSQQDAERAATSNASQYEISYSVQDAPDLPAVPNAVPPTKRFGYPAAGALLGLFLSATILFLAYRADHSLRSEADIEAFGVALLGTVQELRPTQPLNRFTPLRWAGFLRRDYARQVAASISPIQAGDRIAS